MVGDVVQFEDGRPRRRVVLTFPLPADASSRLAEVLGRGFELVDIKGSGGDEEIVLVPSSSRQLTGKLRAAFPDAALLVVEVDDVAHDVQLGGQVLRSLDAGADGYAVARSVDELASIVDRAGRTGSAGAPAQAALTPGEADELSAILDALLVQRRKSGAALMSDAPTAPEPEPSSPPPAPGPADGGDHG